MKLYLVAGALALGFAMPIAAQMPQGPIARADFLAHGKAQFAALDTNHDGVVTKDELVALLTQQFGGTPPQAMVDRIFATLDTNGDGKATADEVEKHTAARFDQWDTNHDGTLSSEEVQAGQQAMMAAMQKPQ